VARLPRLPKAMSAPVGQRFVCERQGLRFEVRAASREAAERYLSRCLADRRPYEPGTYIRPLS